MSEEYVGIAQAAALLGVSRNTVGRWVAAGRLGVYTGGADMRRKLVRVEDVRRLVEPKPVPTQPRKTGAAS